MRLFSTFTKPILLLNPSYTVVKKFNLRVNLHLTSPRLKVETEQ